MCRRLIAVVLLLMAAVPGLAQDADISRDARQLVHKVAPLYPDLARRLRISGIVRLRATVAPNGVVRSIEALGGNPVLLKAAMEAIDDWKYAPAPEETRELIELRFNAPR